MAFSYLTGTTTAGAADEIVDWFATFQAWMVGSVGWTVEAGGGTQNIYFRSLSEVGGLTMLFLHVWRVGNQVHVEVTDDIIPTHTTGEGGFVDSGGVQFVYFMAGDMDAIILCFKVGAGYTMVYAGMTIPFALTVTDETYRMIATSTMALGSILRDFNNVWDVDHGLVDDTFWDNCTIDPYDGSLTISGIWFNTGTDIAGQLSHISAEITDAGVSAEDTITTGRPGATTTWIVLEDTTGAKHAVRTGGVMPAGISLQGANFAVTNGVAVNHPALIAALSAMLVAAGWTDLGDPGGYAFANMYHTTGESGVDDLFVMWANTLQAGDDTQQIWVRDDLAGTHQGVGSGFLDLLEFPVNYWITCDKDCFALVVQRPTGFQRFWGGICETFAPALIAPYGGANLTVYKAVACAFGTNGILRQHGGVWGGITTARCGAPVNTNPNSFDGVTFLVWPYTFFWVSAGGQEPYGQMKYFGETQGGGIANMDTITVGARVYTVFHDVAAAPYVLRTT